MTEYGSMIKCETKLRKRQSWSELRRAAWGKTQHATPVVVDGGKPKAEVVAVVSSGKQCRRVHSGEG